MGLANYMNSYNLFLNPIGINTRRRGEAGRSLHIALIPHMRVYTGGLVPPAFSHSPRRILARSLDTKPTFERRPLFPRRGLHAIPRWDENAILNSYSFRPFSSFGPCERPKEVCWAEIRKNNMYIYIQGVRSGVGARALTLPGSYFSYSYSQVVCGQLSKRN